MNSTASRLATLMGSASLLTLTTTIGANAQQQTAQTQMAQAPSQTVPEQVLITGSLIHGAAAIGVPVTNLGAQDFTETGNATIGDLFRTIPAANVAPGPSAVNNGGQQERQTRVNIRGLDTTGPRSLLMVDGVRFPPQADGLCVIDPSIIPALALQRVDILVDGASATYGSDAIAGVINVVLKRGFDGAITMLHFQMPDKGGKEYQASQLYGRTWDGGDITATYEWIDQQPVLGTAHSKYTADYTPWGLDNQSPLGVSIPGTISTGKPSSTVGTGCTNCWAIPHGAGANFPGGLGPTAPSSGANLIDWAAFTADTGNMGTNVIDPLKLGWEEAAQQKNAFTLTFDQRIVQGVSFFFTGFYANRRVQFHNAPFYSNGVTSAIKLLTVPTTNPYYPTNVPGNLQGKLQVAYDLAYEVPTINSAFELADRYSFGLNLDLPFDWTGQIYDSRSYDTNQYNLSLVNNNYANVALGNTVGGVTKPASIPYLNVFCDPTQFTCNSPTTLAYIKANRHLADIYSIEEKGARFDGPLFALPAGQIKAAAGGNYESDNVLGIQANAVSVAPVAGSAAPPNIPPAIDPEPYTVWAGFAQLDVPVFGDEFNFPLFRKFDLELSWRHDQYHGTLNGGTSNPKVAFTWLVDETIGATLRGSWGTSFRFANAGEYSVVLSDQNVASNLPGAQSVPIACSGAAPVAGSAAADLFAAGFGCNSTNAGGILWSGGPHAPLRLYTDPSGQTQTREGGLSLAPENATNYSAGFELTPQIDFLRGLDVQATFYSIKINNVLQPFNQMSSQILSDPHQRFHFILPSDLGCPVAANANPTSCAPFEKMATATILDSGSTVDISQLSSISWLSDGSTFGSGFMHVEGIDWSASYDWDTGDMGAWNAGITGTYYLHNYVQNITGGPVNDLLDQNVQPAGGIPQNGVETTPRMIYRARLGWSNGPYTITGFMNYQSHFFAPWAVPPNVNNQCLVAGGTVGGGSAACAISGWTNIEPSQYTFDLSFGYDTGDMPANDYLKNVTLQLTIQNLMGIHPAFEYGPVNVNRNVAAYDITKPDTGRIIGVTILKNW